MKTISELRWWDYELADLFILMKQELEMLREDLAERKTKMEEMRADLADYKKEFGLTKKRAAENRRSNLISAAYSDGCLHNGHIIEKYVPEPEQKHPPEIYHQGYGKPIDIDSEN